jgi:pSer/pThr/pTyr-binding forkhead associated (FHA) protein
MDECRGPGESARLPMQVTPSPGPAADAAENSFVPLRLVLRPGTTAVELTRPDMLIGRHTDADIRLSLPDISRRHCRLVYAANRWQIFDLNSLNGVFVNGDRIQQATLDEGDFIRLGSLTFQVELGDSPSKKNGPAGTKEASPRPNVLQSIADALPSGSPSAESPQRKAS